MLICIFHMLSARVTFSLLRLHNPHFLMKRSMRPFYRRCPMCEKHLLRVPLQWERAVSPRRDLRDLCSLLIQFTSGWDGMFTRAFKTLRGARIHLPISPIILTLVHRTSGMRARKRAPRLQRRAWITSVRHNCGAFHLLRLQKISPHWFSAEVVLKLIPGVFIPFWQR